jgi:hypothetical protein
MVRDINRDRVRVRVRVRLGLGLEILGLGLGLEIFSCDFICLMMIVLTLKLPRLVVLLLSVFLYFLTGSKNTCLDRSKYI